MGDLHGMDAELRAILRAYLGKRHLVFLGDYVNRGPHSHEVIELLVDATKRWPDLITTLRGNHDQSVLNYINGGEFVDFISMGGLATIASYTSVVGDDIRTAFRESMPTSHVEFLQQLPDYFERDDVFASHCGPNPARPESRSRRDVALGSHFSFFRDDSTWVFDKPIVCGHYVQRDRRAYLSERLSVIDTGCGTIQGAPLSVLLWPERRVRQFGGY
ncbi:metallophosphoesterase family protein [Nocardia sp. CA-135398]|uniref:metallophosphoesterase family protein n=1 Tax=Nocardia sp. CA-135398 TaxID=3239977 RepID=UPI003D951417